MCGIVGAWVRGKSAEAVLDAVARGTQALAHRGPDGAGVLQIPSSMSESVVAFGHRRLAIIDLSAAGRQPMRDPLTGNWIVYNGEVYNFRELRRELEACGCRFHSGTDTEVILQAYRVWGQASVERLRGMFAFAIWDARRAELFFARDRLGIKPLYYSYTDGDLLFASELRALLAMNLAERKLNFAALNSFLMFGAVQDPLTMIEGVASLPAAHTLTVSAATDITLREYWEVPLDAAEQTPESATEAVGERLADAVRSRLVSDVPLGVFLSGGIDSSALTMLMRRSSPDTVKAFTIGFTDKLFDEAAQAGETALSLGVEHHPILLTEANMLASCRESVAALDQPSLDGINTFHVSRAVRSAGATVALSGLGGDEVFCGYSHFRTVPRLERFTEGWRTLPSGARRVVAQFLHKHSGSDRALKLRALLLDDYGFAHPYFLARALFLPSQIAGILEPDVITRIADNEWAKRLQVVLQRAGKLDAINRVSYLELKNYIPNTLLRDADVMSMRHSLEVRVPFLDHLLIETVLRLPGRIKLDARQQKPLLVRSLPEELPAGVASAPKRGFTLPFEVWLRDGLRAEMEHTFNSLPSVLQGALNPNGVRDVWRRFIAGETSWSRPWALFILYETIESLLKPSARMQGVYEGEYSSSLLGENYPASIS